MRGPDDRRSIADELGHEFARVMDAVPDGMIVADEAGAILAVNSQIERLFGYPPAELLGQSIEFLVPERLRERHRGLRTGYHAEPRARRLHAGLQLSARHRDGREVPVEISLTPMRTGERGLVLAFVRDRSELDALETRLHALSDTVPVGLFRSRPDGTILEVNPALVAMLGYPDAAALLAVAAERLYADPDDRRRWMREVARAGAIHAFQTTLRRCDGSLMHAELSVRAVRGEGGVVRFLDGSVVDVTERRRLEEQLRQAQKMEAVGMLAGGIAHDFNNLLGAITLLSELAVADVPPGDPRRADLDGIQEAVQRATTLTRQLLAFSRRQVLHPADLDPNDVIRDLTKILGRLIGEDIELVTDLDDGAGLVHADPGQLEQILVNLAVNARDAMPAGGRLTIRTRGTDAPADQLAAPAAGAGRCVEISVADTGIGMSPEVQQHIFEPFFTTKGERGTGLGLATVYGIVQQSGGSVHVRSEPGRGSTFTIRLPAVAGTAEARGARSADQPAGGSETILVVEDDAALRLATDTALRRLGYRVLTAAGAEDALALVGAHRDAIHLIISDVVLPGMNGCELIERLRRDHPQARALLTSGYAGDPIERRGIGASGLPFLEKPFTSAALAAKVRAVLDS